MRLVLHVSTLPRQEEARGSSMLLNMLDKYYSQTFVNTGMRLHLAREVEAFVSSIAHLHTDLLPKCNQQRFLAF